MHCSSNPLLISGPQPISYAPTILSYHQSHLSFNTHLKKIPITLNISSSSQSHKFRSNATAVPSPATEQSLYELLGIPASVTQNEIKVAYKQMALKYHPDVSPPECKEDNTKIFIRVQEAYETLSDPGTRAEYDCHMAGKLNGAFAGRRGIRFDEREGWKDRWQSQVMGLKTRSMRSNSKSGPMDSSSMSWGDRIRKRRNETRGSSD